MGDTYQRTFDTVFRVPYQNHQLQLTRLFPTLHIAQHVSSSLFIPKCSILPGYWICYNLWYMIIDIHIWFPVNFRCSNLSSYVLRSSRERIFKFETCLALRSVDQSKRYELYWIILIWYLHSSTTVCIWIFGPYVAVQQYAHEYQCSIQSSSLLDFLLM
jgi:hypothetical protein